MKGVVLFMNTAGFPIGPGLRCSEILSAHVARRFTLVVRRHQLDSCGSDSDVHHHSLTLNRSWRPIGNFRCLQIPPPKRSGLVSFIEEAGILWM